MHPQSCAVHQWHSTPHSPTLLSSLRCLPDPLPQHFAFSLPHLITSAPAPPISTKHQGLETTSPLDAIGRWTSQGCSGHLPSLELHPGLCSASQDPCLRLSLRAPRLFIRSCPPEWRLPRWHDPGSAEFEVAGQGRVLQVVKDARSPSANGRPAVRTHGQTTERSDENLGPIHF